MARRVKELTATVTERGQVTIPAEVRRLLGTRRGDKILFRIEDGVIRLSRPRYTLDEGAGALELPSGKRGVLEAIEDARDEHVERFKQSL